MLPSTIQVEKDQRHPCFFAKAKGRYGRIHLPVAKSCNIQCAYCRMDYDCAHENRPGVSSGVISPEAALERLNETLKAMPHICVAGIAGPGDAFCHPELTLKTLRLVKKQFPDISFCISSNGLNVRPFVKELYDLGARFITITVNAIDSKISAQMVKKVTLKDKTYKGAAGAQILIDNQMETIEALKKTGFTVKVNTVVVPGINDEHCLFIAKRIGKMGVDLMNLLPLIPLKKTDMAHISAPTPEQIRQLRRAAARYVPQMHHCKRCRADAAGCL